MTALSNDTTTDEREEERVVGISKKEMLGCHHHFYRNHPDKRALELHGAKRLVSALFFPSTEMFTIATRAIRLFICGSDPVKKMP